MDFFEKSYIVLNMANSFTGGILQSYLYVALIVLILMSLMTSVGLFLIAKKQGKKLASLLSWIPVIKLYSYSSVAEASLFKYVIKPLLVLIFIIFLSNYITSYQDLEKYSDGLRQILYVVGLLYGVIMWFLLLNQISKKTGNGRITSVGMLILPVVVIPLVGIQFYRGKKVAQKVIVFLCVLAMFVPVSLVLYNSYSHAQKESLVIIQDNVDGVGDTSDIESKNIQLPQEGVKTVLTGDEDLKDTTENAELFDKNLGEREVLVTLNFDGIKSIDGEEIEELDMSNYAFTNTESLNLSYIGKDTDVFGVGRKLLNSDINVAEDITFGLVYKGAYIPRLLKTFLKGYKIKGTNTLELSKESTILYLIISAVNEKYFEVNTENYLEVLNSIKENKRFRKIELLLGAYIGKESLEEIEKDEKITKLINTFIDNLYLEQNSLEVKVNFDGVEKINGKDIKDIDLTKYKIGVGSEYLSKYNEVSTVIPVKNNDIQRVFFFNEDDSIIFMGFKQVGQKNITLSIETTTIVNELNAYRLDLDFSQYDTFVGELLDNVDFLHKKKVSIQELEKESKYFSGIDTMYEISFSSRKYYEPYKFLLDYFK